MNQKVFRTETMVLIDGADLTDGTYPRAEITRLDENRGNRMEFECVVNVVVKSDSSVSIRVSGFGEN